MSRTYVFDLGNTLYPESRTVEEALRTFSIWLVAEAIGYTAQSFRAAYDRALSAQGPPTRTVRVFGDLPSFTRTFQELKLGYLTPAEGLERYRRFFFRRLKPDRRARTAFQFLRDHDGSVVVVTHHSRELAERVIARLGLARQVGRIFSAADAGVEKGTDEFFEALLWSLESDGRHVWYFGDDETEDGACIRHGISYAQVSAYEDANWKRASGTPFPPARTIARIAPATVADVVAAPT
jgi:FMN phosphatase YigB (HAD superfamily)